MKANIAPGTHLQGMTKLDTYSPRTGRTIREDGSLVNHADIISRTELEIARGNYPGAEIFKSYGELTTGSGGVTDHLIWPPAGNTALTVPKAPGEQFTIVSSSDQDAAGGTGIQELHIHYLDGDLNPQVEVIVPTGTTPKLTAATDIRFVNCMHASKLGSGGKADGNISATFGDPAQTHSYIESGKRRCSSSARRVPAGKRLMINGMSASAISGTAAAQVQVRLVTTLHIDTDLSEEAVTFPQLSVGVQDGSEAAAGFYIPVPEGVVVGFEASADKAATINAAFWGWLEDV